MKKTFAILLVTLLLMSALVGCAGAGGLSGKYVLKSMEMDGVDMTGFLALGGVSASDIYLEFMGGGRFRMVAAALGMSENTEGTYTQAGNKLVLTVDDEPVEGRLEGNKIILEKDGMVMIFQK